MKIVEGNLITLAEDGIFNVIIHGCNCFHTMGAGIAKEIKDRYPEAYVIDTNTTKYGDPEKLGDYSWIRTTCERTENSFIIINAYTQFRPGRNVDYDAIRSVFRSVHENFLYSSKIGFPKIGCGIAGGNWRIVSQIIDDIFIKRDYSLVVLPNKS